MAPTAKSKNTKPELLVRKKLHSLGFRFRLHQKIGKLKPDIVLKKWNTCILIHGCFCHHHDNCKFAYIPKSNTEFWTKKFKANHERDLRNVDELKALNWKIVIIWECAIKQGLIDNISRKNIINGRILGVRRIKEKLGLK